MPKFTVFAHCETIEKFVVEADNEAEARRKVIDKEGDWDSEEEWVGFLGDYANRDVEPVAEVEAVTEDGEGPGFWRAKKPGTQNRGDPGTHEYLQNLDAEDGC